MVHTISTLMPEHADDKDYNAHGATGTDLPPDYMQGRPLHDFMRVAVC